MLGHVSDHIINDWSFPFDHPLSLSLSLPLPVFLSNYLLWGKLCFCCSDAQSCLILCNPMDYRLPGSSVHSPGKDTRVGCHSLLQMRKENHAQIVTWKWYWKRYFHIFVLCWFFTLSLHINVSNQRKHISISVSPLFSWAYYSQGIFSEI